jgi:ribosomal protein S18 acetylase RimI-like enzyme
MAMITAARTRPHSQPTACSDGLLIGFHVKEFQMTGLDHSLKGVDVLRPNISIILPDQWRILKALRLDALKDSPNAFLGNYDRESEWSPSQWRAECDASTWVSAAVVEKLVGVAKLARSNDPDVTLHIESMWVNPGWRRRGIAQALVEKLEVLAREQGEEILGLWTFDGNESAQRLYLRLGFHPVGEKGNRQLITQSSEPGSLIWEEELRKNLVSAP